MAVQIFRNGGEEQGFEWLKRYDKQVAAIYAHLSGGRSRWSPAARSSAA